MLGISKVVDRY